MTLVLYDLCGRNPDLRFSPYCWRVKMAIAHKGLSVETIPTPFTKIGAIRTGETRTVPILEVDRELISGSFDIAAFLDDTYRNRPLLFDGESSRPFCRFLDDWASRTLHPIVAKMIIKDIHAALRDEDQEYFRESREARFKARLEEVHIGVEPLMNELVSALAPLRAALRSTDWLGGSQPSFADYIILGPLMWLYTIAGRVPFREDDPVDGWFKRSLDLHEGFASSAKRAA